MIASHGMYYTINFTKALTTDGCHTFDVLEVLRNNYSRVLYSIHTIHACRIQHRRLQSWVGTRARLGYAALDAQLRKRIVTSLYAIRTSVRA